MNAFMRADVVTSARGRFTELVGDASGAVADLGILVPIAAALIVKNGLDAGTVLMGAGALYVGAGLYFGVPVPVQPIKAAAAIAIARELPPATIGAAGVLLGGILIVLGATGWARWLSRIFTPPVVRGLQFGVGLLLLESAVRLNAGASPAAWAVAAFVAAVMILSAKNQRWPLALALVAVSIAWSLVSEAHTATVSPTLWHPAVLTGAFEPSVMWSALTLLVVPQIPLTFGNAVVALADLEHEYFGERSRRVTPVAVSLSCGLANVAVGTLGGMPMCHGSGGLTAHYRSGARTRRMNLLIGAPLLVLGLGFGGSAFSLLALIPISVLAGLLGFTGVMHGLLVTDQRGPSLAIALAMGIAGVWTSNLAIALALGVAMSLAPRAWNFVRRRTTGAR